MKLKIKNLLLLLTCLSLFFLRGRANRRPKSIRKVLILQGAKLGDMVCTTPMFRAVKEKYPQSHLVVVGDQINEKVLEHNTDVDSYIVLDKGNIFSLVNKLRSENVDCACLTGPDFVNLAALYLSGIPLIVTPVVINGWSPYETRPYKILRSLVEKKSHRMGYYAPREYLKLLEAIDIYTENTKKHLNFSKEAEESVLKIFKERGIEIGEVLAGISPSAGNRIKEWPTERFAQVADYLVGKHQMKILILGGPGDSKIVGELLMQTKNKDKIINLQGSLNIDELKALISKLSLFISVDTGPIYIAEAFGISTIDIIGPIDEREQPPFGEGCAVVVPTNRQRAELYVMNARNYDFTRAKKLSESITVSEVIEVISKLLENKTKEVYIQDEFEIENYPTAWQYQVIDKIRKEIFALPYLSQGILHGSYATGDFLKNWSDVDIILFFNKGAKRFYEENKSLLTRLEILIRKLDPLAHHGFIKVFAEELSHYDDSRFPRELYKYGVRLIGRGYLRFEGDNKKQVYIDKADKFVSHFKERITSQSYPKNDYEWKDDLSRMLLFPSILLQIADIYVYKRESFEVLRKTFPQLEFSVIDEASNIRLKWKSLNILRFFSTQLLLLIPTSLSLFLNRFSRKCASRFSGNLNPEQSQIMIKKFIEFAEEGLRLAKNHEE